jgi:3-methyladenine DNA glycosylase AlkD
MRHFLVRTNGNWCVVDTVTDVRVSINTYEEGLKMIYENKHKNNS